MAEQTQDGAAVPETPQAPPEPTTSLEAMQQAVESRYKEGDVNDGEIEAPLKAEEKSPEEPIPEDPKPEADSALTSPTKDTEKEPGETEPKQATEDNFAHLYKIPPSLKGENRSRFTRLRDHARNLEKQLGERDETFKTTSAEVERYKGDSETLIGFRSVVDDAKASPEQLNLALQLIRHVNHGRYEDALSLIDQERQNLAVLSGKMVPGVDLLSKHADLVQEVNDGIITQARAEELALARARGGLLDKGVQARAAENEAENQERALQTASQQAESAERDKAVKEMQAFVEEKKKADINFTWKEPLLVQKLDKILEKIPPSLWVHQIEIAYDLLTAPERSQQTTNPLRPRGGANVVQQPKNSVEAMMLKAGYTVAE